MKRRAERVAELIKREVSKIFLEDYKNNEVGFVTVTDVDLTDDLKLARIYVSIYGSPEKQKQGLEIIRASTPFFRKEIAHRIELRFVPELRFEYDPSVEKATRVFELLDKIKKEEEGKCSEK